jgi:hypothetical protein
LGKIRTDFGPDEKVADLAEELGGIAKLLFPLDAAELLEYAGVLKCQAVIDLAARERRENDLAGCAAEAIPVAIGSIRDATNRLIAGAMFAVSSGYADKQIGERKGLLEKKGISRFTWDERRKKVLRLVAYNLVHPEKVDSSVGKTTPRIRAIPPLRGVALQAQRATILHYAGLATLFVQQLDKELLGDDLQSSVTSRTPSQAYFFNAYISLMYGPWFELAARPSGELAIGQTYSDEMSATTLTRIEQLGQILDQSSPIGPTMNIENAAVRALHFMTYVDATASTDNIQVLAFNELLPAVDAYEWVDWQAVANEPPVDNSYPKSAQPKLMEVYGAWCGWLRADMSAKESGQGVADITGASGALSNSLSEQSEVKAPIQTVARSLAHKAIATYYDTPDYEPLNDGRSLRQRADTFFDKEGTRLALKH